MLEYHLRHVIFKSKRRILNGILLLILRIFRVYYIQPDSLKQRSEYRRSLLPHHYFGNSMLHSLSY